MTALAKVRNGSSLPSLSSWMDDWINKDFNSLFFVPGPAREWNTPRVNIVEEGDHFMLELAAPGLKKSDFNIELDNGLLTISSELRNDDEQTSENYTRREYGFHSFKRTFTLPDTVLGEKISAKYKDGILYVMMPKKEEAKKMPPKTIRIN